MKGSGTFSENKRKVIETLYGGGEMTINDIVESSGIGRSMVNRVLKLELMPILKVRGDIVYGKRQSFYGLKDPYRACIKSCMDGGTDILNIVSYRKKA